MKGVVGPTGRRIWQGTPIARQVKLPVPKPLPPSREVPEVQPEDPRP